MNIVLSRYAPPGTEILCFSEVTDKVRGEGATTEKGPENIMFYDRASGDDILFDDEVSEGGKPKAKRARIAPTKAKESSGKKRKSNPDSRFDIMWAIAYPDGCEETFAILEIKNTRSFTGRTLHLLSAL